VATGNNYYAAAFTVIFENLVLLNVLLMVDQHAFATDIRIWLSDIFFEYYIRVPLGVG